jgi:hypothetical protein
MQFKTVLVDTLAIPQNIVDGIDNSKCKAKQDEPIKWLEKFVALLIDEIKNKPELKDGLIAVLKQRQLI